MTPFLPLALVTSAVAALFFVVAALWVRAVQGLFWLLCAGGWHADFGQGTIHGLCAFSAPRPNTAVKRDAALERVAPYF